MKYFGTDGIRLENIPLLKNLAIKTTYALKKMGAKKVVVGFDGRPYGKQIAKILTKHFNILGVETLFLGIVPSAAVSFLNQKNKTDFGVMITASHNPSYVNGIKIFNNKGEKLTPIKEKKIEKYFDELSFDFLPHLIRNFAKENKIKKAKNMRLSKSEYLETLKDHTPILKNTKLVVDCSNGASKTLAKKVFSKTGAKVVYINRKNGKFVNKNCGATHPEMLRQKVLKHQADIGFAFDGDADRCVCVLKDGSVLSGDNLLVAIARHYKFSKIVGTIYSNGAIDKILKQENISFLRANVGDQAVKKTMNKAGCAFGGERSGHFIFSKIMATGDGMLSALKIANITNLTNLQHFEKMPSKTINITSLNKQALAKKLLGKQTLYEDLLGNEGRVLIRPSGTEPTVRVLIEHPKTEIIEKIEEVLKIE